MKLWKSVVGKLWMTIIGLVAVVLMILGIFILDYIDTNFANSNDIKRLFIYTGVIGFLLTTFFAFFLSTKITQPLLELQRAAVAITQGNYRPQIRIRSSDEIGQLAHAFHHMAGQLEQTITALNHEKEQLNSILRSMSDAVITLDSDGQVVLTNPQGETILKEWNEAERNREQADSEKGPIGMKPNPLMGLFESVVTGAEEKTARIEVNDGVWSVVMTPLYASDAIRGAVAVLRDITEESKLEKLRKDFVANVSHELRTPLSMLQGYSEALLDDMASSPEERKELASIILDESMRMSRLVQNLLDLSRMENDQFELMLETVDVAALIDRVQRKFAAMSRDLGVNIRAELGEGPLTLDAADEDRLEQVLINLIDNGLRYSPPGSEMVIAAYRSEDAGIPHITIEVRDQGEGIPKEDLPYVFERFYKADKARTRGNAPSHAGGGTGLGLSIVKNIVEAHGGKVAVDSKVGEGTTFYVKIPLNQERTFC